MRFLVKQGKGTLIFGRPFYNLPQIFNFFCQGYISFKPSKSKTTISLPLYHLLACLDAWRSISWAEITWKKRDKRKILNSTGSDVLGVGRYTSESFSIGSTPFPWGSCARPFLPHSLNLPPFINLCWSFRTRDPTESRKKRGWKKWWVPHSLCLFFSFSLFLVSDVQTIYILLISL